MYGPSLSILMYLQIQHIYLKWLPKIGFWSFEVLESQTNHVLTHLTGAALQDDVIANFQFQRLGDITDKD